MKSQRRKLKKSVSKSKSIEKFVILVLYCLFVVVTLFSCGTSNVADEKDKGGKENDENAVKEEFFVNFLAVQNGDCIIITLENDKTIMIDTASSSDYNTALIEKTLKENNTRAIDYLILSHPDNAHIGNSEFLFESYDIKSLYIPFTIENTFSDIDRIKQTAKKKQTNIIVSAYDKSILEENFKLYFLYPETEGANGIYDNVLDVEPTEDGADKLCPIIYLEYRGVRFLFSSDSDKYSQEKALNYYKIGLYDKLGYQIDLSDIDVFMASSHGMESGFSESLIKYIKPKAVIFSRGLNDEKYFSNSIFSWLLSEEMNSRVLRTDIEGSIIVSVNENSRVSIVTDLDKNNN